MNSSSHGPSKRFLIRGSIALGIVILILLVQTNWLKNLFHKKDTVATSHLVVGDLIAQDSNGNGIPDWEEKLWGLDPTVLYTNGQSNVEIIRAKKAALGIKDDTTLSPLNQTDQIAQSLFSLTAAVGTSDQANSGAIQSAAANIGASVTIHTINDHYSLKDIKTVKTTPQSIKIYSSKLAAVLKTYNPHMADINVVVQALQTGDFSNVGQLSDTAVTYRDFAQQISKIPVPVSAAQYQLDIINGFYGMADSFQYLVQIQDNSIEGLSGIAAYRKYDISLETALTNMHTYFVRYGILSS